MKVPITIVGKGHLALARGILIQLARIFAFAGLVDCNWTSFESVGLSRLLFSEIYTDTR